MGSDPATKDAQKCHLSVATSGGWSRAPYARIVARPPRIQVPGAAYHVTARAVADRPLFRDDADRRRFLAILHEVVERQDWACHAFCLMTTHYHLLVRTPSPNLATGMQRLNAHYARGSNDRHGWTGHVFGSRYHAGLIERDSHLLEVTRYVALNPVRAGLCRVPADWRWSSYRAILGLDARPSFLTVGWVLAHFGSNGERARDRFRRFVEDSSDGDRDTLSLRGLTP